MKLQIDLSQSGLAMVLKDYQIEAMKMIWNAPKDLKGYSSREVWNHVNKVLGPRGSSVPVGYVSPAISRASIISFLNAMVDDGFLYFYDTTGKGGHRRIYNSKLEERLFWMRIIREAHKKLKEASGWTLVVKEE